MSQRLHCLAVTIFQIGPLQRFPPLHPKLPDSVQVYRTHKGALIIALDIQLLTALTTCVVHYLVAVATGTEVPVKWALVLTPLTAFAPSLPSIAAGPSWNQDVFHVPYVELARLRGHDPQGLAESVLLMSLKMQAITIVSGLPGAVMWWRKREAERVGDQAG